MKTGLKERGERKKQCSLGIVILAAKNCANSSGQSVFVRASWEYQGQTHWLFIGFPEHLEQLAVEHMLQLSQGDVCQGPPFSTTSRVRPDLCYFLHLNFAVLQGW